MEKIKVAYVDFWPEWKDEDFITPILDKHFDVEITPNNPDIVFHSIFGRTKMSEQYKRKKILFLGENWRPSQFNTDFSISFDKPSDTNFRLPLWQAFLLKWPHLQDRLFNRQQHLEFKHFCAFVVSNPSNMLRNNHYDIMSQYKKVNAYGKVRTNNLQLQQYSKGKYWRQAFDDFFMSNPHKFIMSYENSSYPYYCTEKILNAFLVGSIPVYWGDPKVQEDWNSNAFINALRQSDWFDLVKIADTNQSFFEDLYNEPVFTDSQKEKLLENLNNFEHFLIKTIKE